MVISIEVVIILLIYIWNPKERVFHYPTDKLTRKLTLVFESFAEF